MAPSFGFKASKRTIFAARWNGLRERDLERFFYDWLERPGNPDVEVTTVYDAKAQQADITIKQTQAGEPFHFPVKLVLYGADANQTTVVENEMTEKELSLKIPFKGQVLTRIDVDPDQAILSEIKETKSSDLWRAQLLHGTSVPLRLRAAAHFAASKTEEDRHLLAEAFAAEKFWAIKINLAGPSLRSREPRARDALLAGLQDTDARIRRVCLDNLGRYKDDPGVFARIREILEKGDPSYAVQSAAMYVYSRWEQKDAVALIVPYLSRPAFENNVTIAALTSLASTKDPSAAEAFQTWVSPGKPAICRNLAAGLLQLMEDKKLDEARATK